MSSTIKTIAVEVRVRCVQEDEFGNVVEEFATKDPITLRHPFDLEECIDRVECDILKHLEAKK